ncbi:hypothetical protein [Zoogloea sp.]|uniref:hypothetical protein n=1 Tax=Zoogloea sp. TaxID=49181 RepID=UPI00141657D3|nr:MAG: hypothetical protein F9K15_20115 [Zoogloea sp.]
MKSLLPLLLAALLSSAPALAQTPPAEPAAKPAASPEAEAPLPTPPKITRWENTGMTPIEAREWQSYNFSPNDAANWKRAGFAPLVARTWSDKGFDADEAREWINSSKNNRSLMADLDQSDPSQWKREGFTPADRLAWWEAGFAFEDAVLLTRAGMSPAEAAWNGHEKLKTLRGGPAGGELAANAKPGAAAEASGSSLPSLQSIWNVVGSYVKFGLTVFIAFISGGLAFFLLRRRDINRHLKADIAADAPESELPPAATQAAPAVKHRPARRFALLRNANPHCIHCKSLNVRQSRMHPHRFAGINFTEYFRCKQCGRHFAIVSYTPILAAGGGVVLVLTFITSGFIYLLSLVH